MAKQDKIGHDGIVKKISEQTIEITIVSSSACSACHARGACGMSETQQKTITAVRPSFPVSVGERVTVYASLGNAVYSVVLAYILPTVILLTLLIIFVALGCNETASAGIALGGLVIYFLILYLYREKIGKKIKFTVEKKPEYEIR